MREGPAADEHDAPAPAPDWHAPAPDWQWPQPGRFNAEDDVLAQVLPGEWNVPSAAPHAQTQANTIATAAVKEERHLGRSFFIAAILFVILLGAIMIGLHGFSFFSSGAKPAPSFTGMLTATTPDGTVISWHSSVNESWAGVARLHDGKWAVLADGTVHGNVIKATGSLWTAHKSEYESQWFVVPVRVTS